MTYSVDEVLTSLLALAKKDPETASLLLKSAESPQPVHALCELSTRLGFPLYEMDLITEGEEQYALMKRSTNGGGENSPVLADEDDYYEMFMAELRDIIQ